MLKPLTQRMNQIIRRLHSFRIWCWLTFGIGFAGAIAGLLLANRTMFAGGLAAMVGTVVLIAIRRWRYKNRRALPCNRAANASTESSATTGGASADCTTGEKSTNGTGTETRPALAGSPECRIQEFVDTLMREGRYALLLRPQIAAGLPANLLATARARLEQQMTIVMEGDVVVEPHLTVEEPITDAEIIAAHGAKAHVETTFLDRFAVTNRQFQVFVNAGGYDQMPLWEPAIWPAVVDFVDATGHPGPRYWQHGRFPPGKADHPVVGLSWYEAAAYARWVGKRLPTDAEWLKAGSSPVQLSPTSHVQRRFPWGNTMDRSRANLWGGPGDTTTVDDFSGGSSVGGICQLIGNVWEWTTADFELPAPSKRRRDASQAAIGFGAATTPATSGSSNGSASGYDPFAIAAHDNPHPSEIIAHRTPLKTLRGGAFDTYFDHHAACQFASADSPLARKYNIGFRLAISARDLIAAMTPKESPAANEPIDETEAETELQVA
jgi:iron(II)-dependent oxidoreductase